MEKICALHAAISPGTQLERAPRRLIAASCAGARIEALAPLIFTKAAARLYAHAVQDHSLESNLNMATGMRWIGFCFALYALLAAGAWAWVSRAAGPDVAARLEDVTPARAGLVLGAAPTRADGRANRYFVYRIDAAAALYKAGKVDYLIVSGDRRDDGYDEPTAMRDALIAAGVPAERIYRDAAGFHTRDSLARAHALFGQDDAIVISQRFHAERAIFIARAHGLRFTGYAARDLDAFSAPRARETFSRIVALLDALAPERPADGERIALGADAAT